MRQQDRPKQPEGIGEMNTIYAGRNWRGFDPPDTEPAPSEWLSSCFHEEVYEEIDRLFYAGKLKGMDAGDVNSLAFKLNAEYVADKYGLEDTMKASFIRGYQERETP